MTSLVTYLAAPLPAGLAYMPFHRCKMEDKEFLAFFLLSGVIGAAIDASKKDPHSSHTYIGPISLGAGFLAAMATSKVPSLEDKVVITYLSTATLTNALLHRITHAINQPKKRELNKLEEESAQFFNVDHKQSFCDRALLLAVKDGIDVF